MICAVFVSTVQMFDSELVIAWHEELCYFLNNYVNKIVKSRKYAKILPLWITVMLRIPPPPLKGQKFNKHPLYYMPLFWRGRLIESSIFLHMHM